jgi:acyl carrier protein phosphodiesterase
MNYLAHLYLAGEEEELIVGNFIADSIKGSHYKNYPERIAQGILMHREIDFFSDKHPSYLKSAHRVSEKHGKFSGVIIDMFYDYMLASNWVKYSDISLEEFTRKVYSILHKHSATMPEKSRIILQYMSKHNWLLSYQYTGGIRRALHGLSQRMKYYHPMDEAVSILEKDKDLFTKDFEEFFPLIEEHIKHFRK